MDKKAILDHLDMKTYYSSELPPVKWNGNGSGQATCPFHNDTHPSLSVNHVTGKFNCFGCGKMGSIFDYYMERYSVDFPTAKEALAKEAGLTAEPQRKMVAVYDYTDEAGALLFQTMRYEPKDFKQRQPDGEGNWIWNLKGVRLVPYNLPEVLKAERVIIAEGEKDVDTLRGLGLVASCNPMGAGKWKPEYNEHFRGKRVVIIPDNDEAGRGHAQQIAGALQGIAESVRIVDLPGLQAKGDVSNWIGAGGTREGLIELIKAAPEWERDFNAAAKELAAPKSYPGIISLDTVKAERVEWLWPGYIPFGKITIIDGDPGISKSLLTHDLIARITSGQPMPDGSIGPNCGAVILSLEDGLSDTIVPRIEAAGGKKSRVASVQGVPDERGDMRLPTVRDIEDIQAACRMKDARLVVIDPLMGYIGDANSWKDQDIRAAMAPLIKFADEFKIAVLIVRHLNKSTSSPSLYRGGGSIGIIGIARIGLLVAKDPEDDNRRILAGTKSNIAALPQSLTYEINVALGDVPVISWGSTCNHTADTLLSMPSSPEEKSAMDEAKDFLLSQLEHGAVKSKDVMREARAAGISDVTLRRAKKYLKISSMKSEFGGEWLWGKHDEDDHKTPKIFILESDHLRENMITFNTKECGNEQELCSMREGCMLTAGQRELCKVVKPCPKEAN